MLQVKSKGARKIQFAEFEKALDLVATRKVSSASTQKVLEQHLNTHTAVRLPYVEDINSMRTAA